MFGFWLGPMGAATLIVLTRNFKKWDPDGNVYIFLKQWSLQFKQWDPGECILIGSIHLT